MSAAGLLWPSSLRASSSESLRFRAYRDGAAIGHHDVAFSEQAGRLVVDIDIELTVTFAFIPVYRYRHRNREVWSDGRLLQLDSKTDDDGAGYRVSARAEEGALLVEGSSGRLELPGDTLPTSYWHEAMVTRDGWLNTQTGDLIRSRVERLGPEPIEAAGGTVDAERYRLSGDLDCDLWYRAGRWSKLRFAAPDGSTIDYVLQPGEVAAR